MIDFQSQNPTKLLFRNDLTVDLAKITKGKKVLFLYGGGSIHSNGCYDDVKNSVLREKGELFELGNISHEITDIEKGVKYSKDNGIDILIGAGGASVMDATKLIALGHFNQNYLELVKEGKIVDDMKHLPVILIPTFPSSGSEYDSCAVATENDNMYVV